MRSCPRSPATLAAGRLADRAMPWDAGAAVLARAAGAAALARAAGAAAPLAIASALATAP